MSQKNFQHTLLRDPAQTFRVVNVRPHQPALASNTHRYKALSYLWGSKLPDYPIELDGCSFRVRENLWRFLQHAERRFTDSPIFIDAICIDQENITERNSQVQNMGDIFSHADMVLAWLGEGDTRLERALPLLEAMTNLPLYDLEHFNDGYEQDDDRRKRQAVSHPLFVLCALQYWKRVWIVQEILKAKTITLIHGDHELPWNVLDLFLKRISVAKESPIPLREQLMDERMFTFVDNRREPIDSGDSDGPMPSTRTNMKVVLQSYSSSLCSEIRDHIFTLRSLGWDGGLLKVDYGMPLSQLFMKAVLLWGAVDRGNALMLARDLVHHLLPVAPTTPFPNETFTVKLIELLQPEGHALCQNLPGTCRSGCDIVMSNSTGLQNGNPWPEDTLSGDKANMVTKSTSFDDIRFSELRCTDKVLQIEDSCLLVIARLHTTRWHIVGRLVVVGDEVDGEWQIMVFWRSWKGMSDIEMVEPKRGLWQLELDAFNFRKMLLVVGYSSYKYQVRRTGSVTNMSFDSLRWEDEPTGTYAFDVFGRVALAYRTMATARSHGRNGQAEAAEFSMSQIVQVLKSGVMDLTLAELPSAQPTPSWKELLGRT
ncbi:hypothetical protein LTR05_001948 [Lithohypha guttulata]|uniref:Heterokaryon incompatibility domain-containing protein n=1 Tax=Lithohypha guttulata TaxID=1690604 RepID=A0AAN7T7D3_9EURO|nr:hypothetical protein LTR05_001948 [Lithohypha guttulata]